MLRAAGKAKKSPTSGLELDAYFSATKLKWLLDNVPGARAKASRAAGVRHRRQLAGVQADRQACDRRQQRGAHHAVQHPPDALGLRPAAPVRHSGSGAAAGGVVQRGGGQYASSLFGAAIPVAGIAGDQQAATFGQACHSRAWSRTPTAPAASC
jgi:glycerol kinase